jgi:hypothetical protein
MDLLMDYHSSKRVSLLFIYKRQIPASPEFIFPVDSAAFGIYLTCKAFLSKGDEASFLIP